MRPRPSADRPSADRAAVPSSAGSPDAGTPVIDVCDGVHDAESWRALLAGMAADAPGFLEFFAAPLAAAAGHDRAAVRRRLAAGAADAVTLERVAEGLATDIDAHAGRLRAAGVRRQVLHGADFPLPGGGTINDRLAERCARHPGLLEAWCGVDARDPGRAVAEIDRCAALGMRGVVVLPFVSGVAPGDRAHHRVYEHAARLGLPLWLHCGLNLARHRPMTRPADLDHVAARHPALRIVAGHGGWPWVGELVAVMMRQPNIYLDTSAHDPAAMAAPGSGWEPLLFHLPGALRRRVVFGSAAWTHGTGVERFVAGVHALGLDERTRRAWLHDNAAALLGLPAAE
ncbi:amidohydrolase family protein [Spirillospora sp. NBC_00431]